MSTKKIIINNQEIQINPGFTDKITAIEKKNYGIAAGKQEFEKLPVQLSDNLVRNDSAGKAYPSSRVNFQTMRVMARNSTVVRAIISMRVQQVSKLPIKIVPKKDEPTRQFSIFKYSIHDLDRHPAFDEVDVIFLTDIYERIDPKAVVTDKRDVWKEKNKDFSSKEIATVDYLQDKHNDFYKKRNKDIKRVEELLNNPDPHFTYTNSWSSLVNKLGEDLLILDRAVMLKIRDEDGELRGVMPVDGASIRPVLGKYGYLSDEKSYVQVLDGGDRRFFGKQDTIVMMMYPVTDTDYFGYGISPMETLYTTVLADLFIDKGNLDYYRKGGSIPEGFIAVEPPASKEGNINTIDQEQLEAIQRQMQSIIMGDYTQIPIVSGGKFSWIDFKGKRRDMQFKELAEYLVRKICAVYQVSPQDVGVLDGIKSSDGEVQADLTKSKGLHTIMATISEFITNEIIHELRPEKDLKLWYEEPESKEADKNWGTQMKLQLGYLSINEARAKEGLTSHAWGDTPLSGLSKNWQPAKPEGAGGPAGGLPTLPGLPPPPGAPGAQGQPDMSGQDVMKSIFDTWDDTYSDMDISPLVDMFMKSATVPEDQNLLDIKNYVENPYYTPSEAYKNVSKSLGIDINFPKYYDVDDIMQFSTVKNNKIVLGGENPMIKSIAQVLYSKNKDSIVKSVGNAGEEATEYAVLSMLDENTQKTLNNTFYQYVSRGVTESQVNTVKEILNGKL